jgi:hypothetical protein
LWNFEDNGCEILKNMAVKFQRKLLWNLKENDCNFKENGCGILKKIVVDF